MRTVALLLLIANLVFFAWQYPQQQLIDSQRVETISSVGGQDKTKPSGESLMMLKELPSAVAEKMVNVEAGKAPAAASVATGTATPSSTCWTLGPFADNRQADKGLTILTAEGVKGRVQKRSGSTLAGYRVQLAQQRSKAAAERTIAELRRRGAKDIALMTNDGSYYVSLGFFSKQVSARQRSSTVRKLGYKALIQKVYREQTTYWLDLYHATEVSRLDKAWSRLSAAYPEVKRNSINCPASR